MRLLAHIKQWIRPRYSLRTLFLCMTGVAVGLGWILHEARRQQQVMSKLAQMVCLLNIEDRPEWLPECFDIGQLGRVKGVLVGHREVPELEELSGLTVITTLGGNFSQLAPLAGLKNIEEMYLGNTQVRDLTPISNFTRLQSLYLDDSLVSDIAPLSGLHSLKELELSGTQVKELSPLAGLENMEELWLWGTRADPAQVEALQRALPKCKIHMYSQLNTDDPESFIQEPAVESLFEMD